METETDYLGCNDKSDEVMVDHLLDMMSENENWVNKYDSNEYTPPPQGTKFIELESFKAFSNEKSNVYFWQDYICSKKMRYVEVFAVLSGGPCSRGNCMILKNLNVTRCAVAV